MLSIMKSPSGKNINKNKKYTEKQGFLPKEEFADR